MFFYLASAGINEKWFECKVWKTTSTLPSEVKMLFGRPSYDTLTLDLSPLSLTIKISLANGLKLTAADVLLI